jgi:transcriptional regulator with XRE-family HTH domain
MTAKHKSAVMRLLEDVTGGPLTFGELLAAIRMGEEESQVDFARKLGISRAHLCDLEKGRKAVSPARAARFARALGYSEAQFVRLALQGMVREAGLDLTVEVAAARAR